MTSVYPGGFVGIPTATSAKLSVQRACSAAGALAGDIAAG
jgi:hypothetical protein